MLSTRSYRRRCAFFDVDGTLLRGFIIQEFLKYLKQQGVIDFQYPDLIDQVISNYFSGEITYREASEIVPTLYALSITGLKRRTIKIHAKMFMDRYVPERLYPNAKRLVCGVKRLVDLTIAVSGSPEDIVKEVKNLGFDKVYGS